MNAIEKANKLLELSVYNPLFKKYFNEVKSELLNLKTEVKGDKEKAADLVELIRKLNAKTILPVVPIREALRLRKQQDRADGSVGFYFNRVPLNEILATRHTCKVLCNFIKNTLAKGYYGSNTAYVIVVLEDLNNKVKDLYNSNSEEFWKAYAYYKDFIVSTSKRALISSAAVKPYIEDLKLYDNKYIDTKKATLESSLAKLDVFSKTATDNEFDADVICNELRYVFLTNANKLAELKDNYLNKFKDAYFNKTISNETYIDLKSILLSQYSLFVNPLPDAQYLDVITTFHNLISSKENITYMLKYSKREIIEAYEFAYSYVTAFTDEVIERAFVDFMYINNKKIILRSSDADISKLKEITDKGLNTLFRYNIIDIEKLQKYRRELIGDDIC